MYLISRRGTWVTYRNSDYGMPLDLLVNRRLIATIFAFFPYIFEIGFRNKLQKRFDHEKYNLKPKHGVFAYVI